ncbi:NAD(P)-dependent oxidoreductase [Desulfobacter postgatei]|uniref:2-hydroxyacid dehydrogenase n=1 Tax=Desulfobacter postgatei TaxID=2293 RepID=UPI00259B34F9|nr:NAD(P)-dependent oxidoreductase [uncultured Desulfobacter sp.]
MNLLYIGVCKGNLEIYFPDYIKGVFIDGDVTHETLVAVIKEHGINVLMVDVFDFFFTADLLKKIKDDVRLINFSYQSIDSLVDLDAARDFGIMVKKLPRDIYCKEVAEFALAQLLCACKGSLIFDRDMRTGEWNQAAHTNLSMTGKTLGIVGYGNIGRHVATLCKTWGMDILVTKKNLDTTIEHLDPHFRFVDLSTLMNQSDFIVLAVPLTMETRYMVNLDCLAKLKPGSIMVNVSRGDIVDEKAVEHALNSGILYKYCTDVFSKEPVEKGHYFVNNPNTLLSPHVAWATKMSLKKTYDIWFGQTQI